MALIVSPRRRMVAPGSGVFTKHGMEAMKVFNRLVLWAFLTVLGIGVAQAQPFQNGSFETGGAIPAPPGFTTLNPGDASITGWVVMGAAPSQINYVSTFFQPSDGLRSLDLNGDTNTAGGIEQTFTTIAGYTYRVDFDLAGNPGLPQGIKTVRVQATGSAFVDYSFDTTGQTTASMGWAAQTYTFTATGASTTLTFFSQTGGTNNGPALDNVVVTDLTAAAAGIPTLSQWALLLLIGLLGVVAMTRVRVGGRRADR